MRLARCVHKGEPRSALIDGEDVHVLPEVAAFADLLGWSENDLRARSVAVASLKSTVFLPPIDRPDKIICVGLNYRDHAAEASAEVPKHPSLFVRFPSSLVGHGVAVVAPVNSAQFDFEGELAVVIGRRGRHVSVAGALDHVAGYSCFAENSVRDFQQHARQITPGKNFLRSGAMGPWITTADDVGDPEALTLATRLNGREMQRAAVSDMIYPIPDLIAYVSSFTELLPGDVIATGTPAGVGALRDPPVWMLPGDILEVDIPGVGTLVNPVVGEMAENPE